MATPAFAFDSLRDPPFEATVGGLPAAEPDAAIEASAVDPGGTSDRAMATHGAMPGRSSTASWALLVALAGAVVLTADVVPSARRNPALARWTPPARNHAALQEHPSVAVDIAAGTERGTKALAPVDVPHEPRSTDGPTVLDALGIDAAKLRGGSRAEPRSVPAEPAPSAAATQDVPREQRSGLRKTAKAAETPTPTFWIEPSRPPGRTSEPTYQDAGPPVVAGPGPLRTPVQPPEVARDTASSAGPDPGPPLAPGPGPRYDFSSPGALSR